MRFTTVLATGHLPGPSDGHRSPPTSLLFHVNSDVFPRRLQLSERMGQQLQVHGVTAVPKSTASLRLVSCPQPGLPAHTGAAPPLTVLLIPPGVGSVATLSPCPPLQHPACVWSALPSPSAPSGGFAYRCPCLVQLGVGGGAWSTGGGTMAAQKWVSFSCCLLRAAVSHPCQRGTLGSGVWGLQGALGRPLAPLEPCHPYCDQSLSSLSVTGVTRAMGGWPAGLV